MTDKELIDALRLWNWGDAADRIEQLEKELSTCRMAQVVMDNTVAKLNEERDEALAEWRKYEGAWMAAEGQLSDAEAATARRRHRGTYNEVFDNAVWDSTADRVESLTAERDRAYASGYSDAETEISKSALGQSNTFLLSQYANAADHIYALTADRENRLADLRIIKAERDRLREAIMFWLEAEEPDVDAAINMMRAALEGETP